MCRPPGRHRGPAVPSGTSTLGKIGFGCTRPRTQILVISPQNRPPADGGAQHRAGRDRAGARCRAAGCRSRHGRPRPGPGDQTQRRHADRGQHTPGSPQQVRPAVGLRAPGHHTDAGKVKPLYRTKPRAMARGPWGIQPTRPGPADSAPPGCRSAGSTPTPSRVRVTAWAASSKSSSARARCAPVTVDSAGSSCSASSTARRISSFKKEAVVPSVRSTVSCTSSCVRSRGTFWP